MPKLLKSFILSTSLLFHQQAMGVDRPLIQRYEKSFRSQGRIDFAAVFVGPYSEVRWDKDGDGQIDLWLIQDGSLEIQEEFENGEVKSFTVRKRIEEGRMVLKYAANAKSLRLVESLFLPFRTYNNEDDEMASGFGAELERVNKPTKQNPAELCKTPIEAFFNETPMQWAEIQKVISSQGQHESLASMISDSCKNSLSQKDQEQLFKAVKNVYSLDLDGEVEDNKILSCLVRFKQMQNHFPSIVTRLAQGPVNKPQLKINCVASDAKSCNQASFDEKSCRINLKVSKPSCQPDMEPIFTSNVFHETLHAAAPDLSEESIQAITSECLDSHAKVAGGKAAKSQESQKSKSSGQSLSDVLAENKEVQKAISEAAQKNANVLINEDSKNAANTFHIEDSKRFPTAAIKEANSKVVSNNVTNVPAEIAAGKVSPGTPIGEKSGMASLNSDFRPTTPSGESSKPTLNESYSRSVARTSSPLRFASDVVRSAVVTPALAQSQGTTSDSRPSRSIASSGESKLKNSASSSSSRSAAKTGQPAWISKSAATVGSSLDSNSASGNLVLPSSPQIMPSHQASTSKQVEASSEIAGSSRAQASAPPSQGKPTARTPASSIGPGHQAKSLAPSAPSGQNAASGNSQRDFYSKQLTMKRGSELWDFVKKNNENLKTQGIHILDTNNRIWGHVHPETAVIRFREQNSRLIREN